MSVHPLQLARTLHRRSSAIRAAREERRLRARLRLDPAAPELLISPHLDDAALDCWRLLASDRELEVVNLFAGIPPAGVLPLWDQITGASDSAERVGERIAEDAQALAQASRRALNMPFLDAQYRTGGAPSLDSLDRAVAAVIPATARVHVPAGIGSHPDHLLARRYGRTLLSAGIPVSLYADLPYCVLHGWPHWVDGREREAHRNVDAFWSSFLADVPEMPALRDARVERLDEPAAAAKLAALRCYRTQFASLSYGGRGMLADPAIHGFEVSWELNAADARTLAPARRAAAPSA